MYVFIDPYFPVQGHNRRYLYGRINILHIETVVMIKFAEQKIPKNAMP